MLCRLLFVCCLMSLSMNVSNAEVLTLFIGTGGEGIYATTFDTESGKLAPAEMVAETKRPSFIWVNPAANTLYSISEMRRGGEARDASIVAWQVDPKTAKLTQLGRQDAMGDGPCFVTINSDATYAAIANYGSGSVAVYPLDEKGNVAPASGFVQHTGSSVDPKRQTAPHAHSIRFDPSGKRVAAADLGTDKVYLFDLKSDGSLEPSDPPALTLDPGTGPRHFVFSPDERFLLALGELSGTITTYDYASATKEKLAVVSTMAKDVADDAPRASAEILFHPNGKFVYCSNRGPNEIAVFKYEPKKGTLERIQAISSGGTHPRNFRFTPDGKFLLVANQMSNNIVIYSVDVATGLLTATGDELSVPAPMCLKFWTSPTQ